MAQPYCDFNNSFMSFNPSDSALNNQALGAGDLSCGNQASVQFGGGRRRRRKTRRTNRKKRSLRRRSMRKMELSEDELEVIKPKRRSRRSFYASCFQERGSA